jgi:hypothetical protein
MTDPNGWPNSSKPGVPLNPEQFGAHRIRWFGDDETWLWHPRRNVWINSVGGFHSALDVGSAYGSTYLGPCHTPAEVEALVDLAIKSGRLAEREAAYQAGAEAMRRAAMAACVLAGPPAHTYASENAEIYRAQDTMRDRCVDAIRALPLPKMEDKTND